MLARRPSARTTPTRVIVARSGPIADSSRIAPAGAIHQQLAALRPAPVAITTRAVQQHPIPGARAATSEATANSRRR